jgi:hypothetical protein
MAIECVFLGPQAGEEDYSIDRQLLTDPGIACLLLVGRHRSLLTANLNNRHERFYGLSTPFWSSSNSRRKNLLDVGPERKRSKLRLVRLPPVIQFLRAVSVQP